MDDGAGLAGNVLRPEGVTEKVPAILGISYYGRDFVADSFISTLPVTKGTIIGTYVGAGGVLAKPPGGRSPSGVSGCQRSCRQQGRKGPTRRGDCR